jgi:tetratricopeptide (TPR) repeat protein
LFLILSSNMIFFAMARSEESGALPTQSAPIGKISDSQAELERLLQQAAMRPLDAGLQCRIAKLYTRLIPEAGSKSAKREMAGLAVAAAEEAVRIDPDDSASRLTLAISLGRAAQLESPRTQVEMSKRIQEEAAMATRLNPREDYAWHVLGRWNYELANFNPLLKSMGEVIYGKFPDASNEKAAECFRTAIAVGPPRVIHHVEYARTLLALGQRAEARKQLERALALASSEPEDEEAKGQGRKLLEGL